MCKGPFETLLVLAQVYRHTAGRSAAPVKVQPLSCRLCSPSTCGAIKAVPPCWLMYQLTDMLQHLCCSSTFPGPFLSCLCCE